jgi:hypothetical protein
MLKIPTLLVLLCSLVHADSIICCGGDRVFIVDKTGQETWTWQASDSPQIPANAHALFRTTDECKPVGEHILITSSSGGVALIERASKHCAFYTQAKNAHSACLLPGMRVAVAASTGGDHLYLFNRRKSGLEIKPMKAIPLKGAHGVIWDAASETCWALGNTALIKLDRNFEIVHTYPLPTEGGHDLSRAKDGRLLITTNTAVYRFDRTTGRFDTDPQLGDQAKVKSVDEHPVSGKRTWQQASALHWWGHEIHVSNRDAISMPDERLYKVRWDVPQATPESETIDTLKRQGVKVFESDGHVKELVANQLELQDDDLHWFGWLPLVTDISLEHTAITDKGIAHLAACDRLEWLNLWQTAIGDEGLKVIGGFKRLQHLPIGGTNITDEGMHHLRDLKDLIYLGLRETRIGDAGLRHLTGLTQLESLNLMETPVTDASIPILLGLEKLKTLRLEGCRISPAGVARLRSEMPQCLIVY